MSNGHNLKQGARHCREGGTAKVQWDTNDDSNEEIIVSVVEIKKSFFNSYFEHFWRMVFDVP